MRELMILALAIMLCVIAGNFEMKENDYESKIESLQMENNYLRKDVPYWLTGAYSICKTDESVKPENIKDCTAQQILEK